MVDYEHLPPIPIWYGIIGSACSFGYFTVLHFLVSRYVTPARVRPTDVWKWKNICLSFVHSTICGVWILSSLVIYPEISADPIAYHNLVIYMAVTFSTGYFFCDFADMLINSQAAVLWEVTLHHIAVLMIFICNLLYSRYIGFTLIALLVEVNSIFLHLRKLMQMAGVCFDNPVYQANAIMNLLTFVAFRFLALVWITLGMVWYHSRTSASYFYLLGAIMFVQWIINSILFWRLVKSDVLRRISPKFTAAKLDEKSVPMNSTHVNNNFVPNSTENKLS